MSTPAQTPPSDSPGAWLTRQMERRSIGVQQLADALGVTGKTIYYWRDDKTAVSETRVPRLAEVLGVSELEARRGLGYWVPSDNGEAPAKDTAELEEIITDLANVLERFRRWRRESD